MGMSVSAWFGYFESVSYLSRAVLCAYSLSSVWLFATLWTVAYRLFCPLGFSRQEYCRGLPCLFQGIFPTQGSKTCLPHCRQILYHLSHQLSYCLFSINVLNFIPINFNWVTRPWSFIQGEISSIMCEQWQLNSSFAGLVAFILLFAVTDFYHVE